MTRKKKSENGSAASWLIDLVFWVTAICFSGVGYLFGKNDMDRNFKKVIISFFLKK